MNHPTLFDTARDIAPAVAARDHAIDRAAAGAGDWLELAIDAIKCVAMAKPDGFLTDDVWHKLDEHGAERPKESRAMGAAFIEAKRRGFIKNTGEYRRSAQVQCHANPRSIWRAA